LQKVLGENGSVIFKSLEITNNDEIMTVGVCHLNFLEIHKFDKFTGFALANLLC